MTILQTNEHEPEEADVQDEVTQDDVELAPRERYPWEGNRTMDSGKERVPVAIPCEHCRGTGKIRYWVNRAQLDVLHELWKLGQAREPYRNSKVIEKMEMREQYNREILKIYDHGQRLGVVQELVREALCMSRASVNNLLRDTRKALGR